MKDGGSMKNIIKSNKLNELADKLIQIILNSNDPFDTIKVVTNSLSMQQYFKSYWLANYYEILMNVEFINVNGALSSLLVTDKSYKLVNKELLKSLLIKYLAKSECKEALPSDISEYLYVDNKIDSIKLYDLSDALSSLFVEYNNDNYKIHGWQKQIYDLVISDALSYNQTTLNYMFENKLGYSKENNNVYFFGFVSFNNLQQSIIDEYSLENDITLLMLEESDNVDDYSIISSPSLLREIETVHSKICHLINTKNCKYSDFLVLAPDVSLYEGIIPRVFNQDNVSFPSIPYSINDKKKVVTNVTSGLRKLIEIFSKGYYTRYDFFELVNNPDIKQARNISDEDVDTFTNSILSMNVYRNKNSFDDWNYAKHRVLLSKVSSINDIDENIVELNDGSYLPYANISLDDETIIKFVSLIDDINSWCELLKMVEYVTNDNLLAIKDELRKWFSIKDKNGFETNNYFKRILSTINQWYTYNISDGNVPLNSLMYQLLDTSKITSYKTGEFFTKGVSFADFNANTILSSKYIFFLNAGAKQLPIPVVKKELDIRDYEIYDKEKIRKSFFIQASNATSHFYVSYINRNLKTDEELYPSTFIIDLLKGNKLNPEVVSLDETRSWNELFTKKEYKNKDYFLGLLSSKVDNNQKEIIDTSFTYLKKVTLKNMASYLQEPLQYKAKSLFGSKDETDEKLKDQYEPFTLDNLTFALLIRKIATELLIKKQELTIDQVQKLYDRLNLEHKLPDLNNSINLSSFEGVMNEAYIIYEYINKISSDYEIIKLNDLTLNHQQNEYRLTSNQDICRIINDKDERIYIQIKSIKIIETIKSTDIYIFLEPYIASLMDIAYLNDEKEYTVILDRGPFAKVKFNVTSLKAKEILDKIYASMNDYSDNTFNAIELLTNTKMHTLDELIEYVSKKDGPWKYFDDKNMFDYEKQLGYNEEDFIDKFNEVRKQVSELLLFVDLKEIESEE